MISCTSSNIFAKKLCGGEFFSIYSQAFEVATGCHLNLQTHDEEGGLSVPVHLGELTPFFLIVVGLEREEELADIGMLRSFALQLEDEIPRTLLEVEAAEPKCVRDAKNYIKDHLGERVHLKEVSEVLGVTPFLLCRLFKKHTGMTMTEFVSRHRVELARKFLQDPVLQISQVAEQSGFTSISPFNRSFLKYAGESPSRYRLRLEELEHYQLMSD